MKQHKPNKDKPIYQHPESQSFEPQKAIYQCQNKIINSQVKISPLKLSNPTTVDTEKCNIAKAHDTDFLIPVINMSNEILNISTNDT